MTRKPKDTSKADPIDHLGGAYAMGTSNYIENMEAAGQRQLVNSDVLPVDTGYGPKDDAYIALGFTFGEKVDDLFREATLPDGWSRKGSDHAMWSYIIDERGLERVNIFYKAAFYDRRAHMGINNVGYSIFSSFTYNEAHDPAREPDNGRTLDEVWTVLSFNEKAQVIKGFERWLDDYKRHPDIYGKDTNVELVKAKYEQLLT
jgi:hypothetical protein